MLDYMRFWLQANLGQRERGATMVEYVLIVAVIAIAVAIGLKSGLADAIVGVFEKAELCVNNAEGCA